ncbi:hypothetical protein ABZ858_12610 [Streptomyces sp. NPDC047017]|uniref:hypothetical protein n=1 Tax=Streptomyces sp. NPDC047017 TaxID=3155024 RepID=UPI0033E02722
MRTGRPVAVAAGLAGVLLSAAGCGVPTSGVIDAGAPAVGVPAGTVVYFVAGDTLRAVPRTPAGDGDPVAQAVRLLLAGPNRAEARTLATELPAVPGQVAVTTRGDTVTVRFPAGVARLGTRAMEQLTCTVARARRLSPPVAGATGALPGGAQPDGTETGGTPDPRHLSVRAVGATWATARAEDICPTG